MSEIKYTAGPWRATERDSEIIIEGGCTEVVAVLPNPARHGFGVVSVDERQANAERIADAVNFWNNVAAAIAKAEGRS